MKVTVDLAEEEISDLCQLTGETKKGPAVRKLVMKALMMEKRKQISAKFLSGEWTADLPGYEDSQKREHEEALQLRALWED